MTQIFHLLPVNSLILIYTGRLSKEEVYERLLPILDTSNFDPKNRLYNPLRMNELTFWKDEMKYDDINAFAGVASKSYAIDIDVMDTVGQTRLRGREETKCKGVSRGVRKKDLSFHVWKAAVLEKTEHRVVQYNITSKNHKIHTMRVNKLAVSPLDDKRYVNACGIHTVPYGSKFIKDMERLQRCIFCRVQ